ncbi:MAG: PAS domain S-box protein [Bacteroidota bacterium]
MNGARIMVVEDEGIEALDIQNRLISMGYIVPYIAVNGKEAMAKAAEIRPDLVLMDIMLHGEIDGVNAAEQIRAVLDIPVIYLTAFADEKTLQRAMLTEPYGYIVKPFNERELQINIDMALYKHKMERKLKESQKWFAITLKSIGDAVITTDQNGLITFMNPMAEKLMGWGLDEALNKRLIEVFNIINCHTRQPVENPVDRVIHEGVTVGLSNHTILISRNGKEIPIDDSAAPIKDDQGNLVGVVLVFRDITERYQVEQERQSTVEFLRLVNRSTSTDELIREASVFFQKQFHCENVSISLSEGNDYPQSHAYALEAERRTNTGSRCNVEGSEFKTLIPLTAGGGQIGQLQLDHCSQEVFSTRTDELLKRLTDYLAVALAKLRAEDGLRQARDELEMGVQDRTMQLTVTVKQLEEEIVKLKAMEKALRASEQAVETEKRLLHEILELLPAYLILLTPDYHVPYANRFFRERFGDPQGRRCFKYLFGRDEPCEICETFTVFKTMKPVEWEWKGPDGRDYYIYDFPFIETNGSTLIMEMGIDITQRKLAEKALQEASAYNRNLIEASLDPLVMIGPGGTITDVNAATEFATGYSRKELIGTDFSDYFTAPDKARAGYQRVFQEGSVRDYALEIRHRDGHITPVLYNASVYRDDTGNVIGVFAIARDISKLKQAEMELQKHWELLQVTLDSLGEGVIATDQEGQIMLINQFAASLTGYSQTESIGKSIFEIFYVIDDKTSEPITIMPPQKILKGLILVTRELKEIPIALNSSTIKAVNGRIIGTVMIFQDISEKQKVEQELLKTEKLESLGILAGGIAHDFNNVLAAILANLQLAKVKYEKHEDIGKYLEDSIITTHRASDLTKQLLTFSKGGAPVKKTASLSDVIRDTAQFALRGSKVRAKFNIPGTLWSVEVDIGQISQVIHNLVINAKQAMPKGGIIEITAENIEVEPRNRFNPGNYIKITVKDQGIGIPNEKLNKIFDPFYTTKKEGTGLGLAISYSIIRQHDGYLEVESKLDVGTNFSIYLPALPEAKVLVEDQKEVASVGEGLKILLMDDEELILKSVGEMLEYLGHQVLQTFDGEKAIKLYRQAMDSGNPFDIVIMDLTVPGGMGGQEAIAYLRDIDPHVKAIVSSGYANDPIMADYERFGFCGVVTKPYQIDELLKVINRVIDNKQLTLKLSIN